MSQTILPPSPQPEQQPPAQPPAPPPAYYYPTYDAPAVVTADPTPGYQPDPPKKQPLIWRIIKWPIRQVFKGIYLTGRAARNHKVVSAILLILILALAGAGVVGYRYLNPPSTASTGNQAAASAKVPDTPFTIVNTSAPPLPNSVIHYLHSYKAYDGQEQWDSLSPSFQQALTGQGVTEQSLQAALDQLHAQGLTFEQFIYSGGYIQQNGLATFSVEVVYRRGNQGGIENLYFYVDFGSGLILAVRDLTPGSGG